MANGHQSAWNRLPEIEANDRRLNGNEKQIDNDKNREAVVTKRNKATPHYQSGKSSGDDQQSDIAGIELPRHVSPCGQMEEMIYTEKDGQYDEDPWEPKAPQLQPRTTFGDTGSHCARLAPGDYFVVHLKNRYVVISQTDRGTRRCA